MPASPKSASPKRSADDELLDQRISSNEVHFSQQLLLVVGGATAIFPAYVAHAVFDLIWTDIINLVTILAVSAGTAVMLSNAYAAMIQTTFFKKQRHYDETKTQADAAVLRDLRLQASVAYSMFFINVLFVAIVGLIQGYLFRTSTRVGYTFGALVASAVCWFLAQKNEETRTRKLRRF